MSELKPCPFCGGTAEKEKTGLGWIVSCSGCGAIVRGATSRGVQKLWNTRTAERGEDGANAKS